MPTVIDETALARLVKPQQLVFVPGSSGAPQAFMNDLSQDPARSDRVHLLTSYIPGINKLDIDALADTVNVTGLFMQPGLSKAQRDRRYKMLPMSYAGFVRYLQDSVNIDLAVVQLSPPDAYNRCSLGPAAEFLPTVLGKSRRVLGLINQQTPRIEGAPSIAIRDLDYVCEVDTPLPVYAPKADAVSMTIGACIANFIEDGSVVQMGLGKVPTALAGLLKDRRNLRLHSGMLSDGLAALADAGALDPDFSPTACVLVGSADFYRWAQHFTPLRIVGCDVTHDPRRLLDLDGFVAVNSALEIDLFGQCNLEHAGGRSISGAGGAPDFARAARQSRNGCSIVALNATYQAHTLSRVVPFLTDRAITTLSRVDVDVVITEFGVARLTGVCVHERAEALIAIAAPQFREELSRAWRAIASRL